MTSPIKQSLKKERLKSSKELQVVYCPPEDETLDNKTAQADAGVDSQKNAVEEHEAEHSDVDETVSGLVSEQHSGNKDWALASFFEEKEAPETAVYLFGDIVEELTFAAHKMKEDQASFGILCGGLFEDESPDTEKTEEKNRKAGEEYIEISAFRDIFPVRESLDYAAFLRRDKSLLNTTDYGCVTGIVRLTAKHQALMLEDVFLMRTYFNLPWQVMVLVSGEGKVSCYRMDEDGMMVKTGFYIVSLPHVDVNKASMESEHPSDNA